MLERYSLLFKNILEGGEEEREPRAYYPAQKPPEGSSIEQAQTRSKTTCPWRLPGSISTHPPPTPPLYPPPLPFNQKRIALHSHPPPRHEGSWNLGTYLQHQDLAKRNRASLPPTSHAIPKHPSKVL